jgi:4-hydroxythreonine-4-phosphate dehydrogenase
VSRPRIGITVGDPAGIGPEVTAAALASQSPGSIAFRVYGDIEAVRAAGGLPRGVETRGFQSARVAAGQPDPAASPGVVEAIESAARDCLEGDLDAMVTAPISKELLGRAGFEFPGHTELLEQISGEGRAVMMLVGGSLRVALVTIHCAFREVLERLKTPDIELTLQVLDRDLRRRFGVDQPRIAVCGLNPHAGEGGRFGDEESRIIAPAIAGAQSSGIAAEGPLPADSLFHRAAEGAFDAVVAMYHDQGLGPLKLHAFGRAVNVTLGLPLIRTSVDHGTAFDIAGQGRADPGSMTEAIRLAVAMARTERASEERA